MRREGQSIRKSKKTTGYTFYFQITNNGGRRACSVRIAAPNLGDATTFFRQNWPVIESLARDSLAKCSGAGRAIKLARLVAPSMPAMAFPHRETGTTKVQQASGQSCWSKSEAAKFGVSSLLKPAAQ